MNPQFWKLSQGPSEFAFHDIIESISSGLVYMHKDTGAKGGSSTTQAEDFINAPIGDYFYLTHGNTGMYLIGQLTGPANLFSKYGDGWLERRYKFIFPAIIKDYYTGVHKWWAPNDNSTFTRVPESELLQFEKEILIPFFDVRLKKFGL